MLFLCSEKSTSLAAATAGKCKKQTPASIDADVIQKQLDAELSEIPENRITIPDHMKLVELRQLGGREGLSTSSLAVDGGYCPTPPTTSSGCVSE
jgi:hypothetical protein